AVLGTVQWTSQSAIDTTHFGHATGTNPDQITIKTDGDYLLVYNDSFTSAVERANPKVQVYVNGAAVSGAEVKSHYIRGVISNHQESSGSLVFLLRDLNANDIVSVGVKAEGAAGTVDDDTETIITLIRKP